MITTFTKHETGVPGLDILTHSGIPQGRTTLICGRSGTGKTILGLQIATHLASLGDPAIILGIEEPVDDLIATARSLGFDPDRMICSSISESGSRSSSRR